MSRYPSRLADYTRICTDCDNHSVRGSFHLCSASRCLITGRVIEVSCGAQRSQAGACGPDGLRYVAKQVVSKSRGSPVKVVASE